MKILKKNVKAIQLREFQKEMHSEYDMEDEEEFELYAQ